MPPRGRTDPHHHGILLVDKPSGWTSHDVVAKVRGFAHQRQVGHTGTLDPMATGLLVLCLGRATRLVEYMTGHDKTYEGEIRLGASTSTDDTEGDPVETAPLPPLTADTLRRIEAQFSGRIEQVPPAFSAVKIAGQRAYAVARKGGTPALVARPVTIHALHLEATSEQAVAIAVTCSSGTYVRSLARDIGVALGSRGHLAALRRTRAGLFNLSEAWTLDELATLSAAGLLGESLLPPDEGVADIAAAVMTPERATTLAHGGRVLVESAAPIAVTRVFDSTGEFIAIAQIREDEFLQPLKVFTL